MLMKKILASALFAAGISRKRSTVCTLAYGDNLLVIFFDWNWLRGPILRKLRAFLRTRTGLRSLSYRLRPGRGLSMLPDVGLATIELLKPGLGQ